MRILSFLYAFLAALVRYWEIQIPGSGLFQSLTHTSTCSNKGMSYNHVMKRDIYAPHERFAGYMSTFERAP